MERETIKRIEVLGSGELLAILDGEGKPSYQYVYRAGAGVSWDQAQFGFKSTPMKDWSCSHWYRQIVKAVREELGVELGLSNRVTWVQVPTEEQVVILNEQAI